MKVGIQELSKEDSIYNSALYCAIHRVDDAIEEAQERLIPSYADIVIDYLYSIKEDITNNLKGADHMV